MRPIATDTNDFPSLRRDGKIYVDKTEYLHRMVSDANTRLFFISRPRRFGKSLTLSVLKALFSGRRELFEGLYIVCDYASAGNVWSRSCYYRTWFPVEHGPDE